MAESPALKLVPPAPSEPMPKAVDVSLSLTDFTSPGHWLMWAIDKICGVNPAEWVEKICPARWPARPWTLSFGNALGSCHAAATCGAASSFTADAAAVR